MEAYATSYSAPIQGCQRYPQNHHADSGLASHGVEWRWAVPWGERWRRSISSDLHRAYGPLELLVAVGHLWMPPPCKSTICPCLCCILFWQGPAAQRAVGHKNDRRTADPFGTDCYPTGSPLRVLSASLISTHKHGEETWLCVFPFLFPSIFS